MNKRKVLPTICLDQHIEPELADQFRLYFRVLEVSKSGRFRGRDERDFLPELYRENAIFVTCDEPFVNDVLNHRTKHAGIVFVPATTMDRDDKNLFGHLIAGWIQGAVDISRFEIRNTVLYPADDGLHSIVAGNDKLELSWDHAFEDI